MWDQQTYVRKLYPQELGFRDGKAKQAGRYFFISKEFAGYFPPLSDAVLNDYAIIEIVPPDSTQVVMAKYKYHNSKIVEGNPNGRNEYRIYLNAELDPGGDYYKDKDIIILHKYESKERVAYKMYHFSSSRKDADYAKLEELLQKYGSARAHYSHALIPIKEIPFLSFDDINFGSIVVPTKVQEDALDEPVQADYLEDKREEITRLVRSASFRDLVMFFYNFTCSVTGTVISYGSLLNLEAAHIIPREHNGQNSPKNGLSLSRDMHWAFDKGFFTLDENYNVMVHKKVLTAPLLKAIDSKKILLPQDQRAWPSTEAVEWHRRNIFGLFMKY